MQIRNTLVALLCMSLSLSVQGQTDSSTTKNSFKPKKAINFTKLELVYKKEIQRFESPSYSGGFRTAGANPSLPAYRAPSFGSVNVPYIQVNGSEPKRLDKHANLLRPYYAKAPLANEQLRLMNQQQRRGAVQGWTLVGIGTVGAVAGGYSAVNKASNEDLDYSTTLVQGILRVLPGLAIAYAGFELNRYHSAKAKKHLEQSIEIYNKQYYKPVKADSTVNRAVNTDSTTLKSLVPKN